MQPWSTGRQNRHRPIKACSQENTDGAKTLRINKSVVSCSHPTKAIQCSRLALQNTKRRGGPQSTGHNIAHLCCKWRLPRSLACREDIKARHLMNFSDNAAVFSGLLTVMSSCRQSHKNGNGGGGGGQK